ncbi:hypothetical protein NVP2275O_433 [Vibrio phage 2.275.O._10N.286.54.E11]|nr:hypothetical protein NVP2275O_433 [Vibrio phage 2.275.O._10N.286.54.E11]
MAKDDRLKNSKEAASYRRELLKKQKGLDPITKEIIKDGCLDHQHFGEQRCRAVLDRTCNTFEGKVQNSFNRYMKHLTDKPLHEVLRNLADYLEADVSNNKIHHTALTMDIKKFKGLKATEQKRLLTEAGLEPFENVKKRSNQARKLIKDGTLKVFNGTWTINKKEP